MFEQDNFDRISEEEKDHDVHEEPALAPPSLSASYLHITGKGKIYGRAEGIVQEEFDKLDMQEHKGGWFVTDPSQYNEIAYIKMEDGYAFRISYSIQHAIIDENHPSNIINKYFKNPEF